MKRIILTIFVSLAALACTVENPYRDPSSSLTISAGFDQDGAIEGKTFIKDPTSGTIWWGTSSVEKVLFAFDTSNKKNTFISTSTASEAVRSFTCDTWTGGDWKLAVWTGYSETKDNCSLDGYVLSGPTLRVANPQIITNSQSFNNSANIAVMKPEDGSLRNVFGYLRFTLPTYAGSSLAAIKSVTFTADEYVAGNIRIDYSGSEPVVTVVSNESASKSLTLNTRYKGNGPQGYEAGYAWMILPPGTYHNATLTITPFTSEPVEQDATTGEAFTVPFSGNVVVQRSKYTDCGELPITGSSPSSPSVPTDSIWPNDPDAFDYGVGKGQSRTAEHITAELNKIGIPDETRNVNEPFTMGGVTYGGPGLSFWGNRFITDRVSANWSSTYPNIIPSQRYFSFKVNRPGTLKFYPALADINKIPTYYLAVVTTVGNETSAKIVDTVTPTSVTTTRPNTPYADSNAQPYIITMTISEDDLKGITKSATVYLYHNNETTSCSVNYWPLVWTPSVESSGTVDRVAKILLAGDSLVAERDASTEQKGWGQCLAAALGGDVQVSNHAVGGESTRSFINSGKWDGLLSNILVGDVVLVQFMHNDKNKSPDTHATDPATTYRDNLNKFITDVRDREGVPVLVVSPLTRIFDGNGLPKRSLGDFPAAMRAVATETSTPLIDCEEWSYQWLSTLGYEGSDEYFMEDDTHFTGKGAEAVATFIASELKRQNIWK